MSSGNTLIQDAAARLLADFCDRESFALVANGAWPSRLWEALESAGLVGAALTEERGGPGLNEWELASLVKLGGRHSAPIPMAESFLGEQAAAAAGLASPDGVVTIGPVLRDERLVLSRQDGRWVLDGVLHRLPWARHADAIVAVADCEGRPVTVIVRNVSTSRQETNLAWEPRDTVRFDRLALPDGAAGEPGRGLTQDEMMLRGALYRVVAMTGAIERALELSVRYANERIQFGRRLATFQAIQQQIAVLASESVAANAAATGAVEAVSRGAGFVEIAAAKTRVGEAAGVAAGIAHQVHGAMGFTQEHELHRVTTRLWSWRDEFGSESEWAMALCRAAAPHGGEGFWNFLIGPRQRTQEK